MNQSQPDSQIPFFYAAEQRGYPRDRLFRVYTNESMLAGAYVAGQVREDLALWEAIGRGQRSFRWLALPLIRRIIARRMEREASYDQVDPFADGFLDLDHRNFQIAGEQIWRIRFQHKHLRDVIGSVGILRVETFEGRSRRLVVMGDVDPIALVEGLRLLDRAIEVTGSDPYHSPEARRMAYAARDLSIAGIVSVCILVCIGVGVAATWALGLLGHWRLVQIVVGVVVGIGAILKARKMSAGQRPERVSRCQEPVID